MKIIKTDLLVIYILIISIPLVIIYSPIASILLVFAIFFQINNFIKTKIITPNFIVTLGWLLPSTIAFVVPTSFLFYKTSYNYYLSVSVKVFCLILTLFMFAVLYNKKIKKIDGFSFSVLKVTRSKLFMVQYISLFSFVLISFLNDFQFPIFAREEIVEKARDFFIIPGSSTLFNLAAIGSFIHHMRLENYSKIKKFSVYFLDLAILFSFFLTGKRMGIALVSLSWFIIYVNCNPKFKFRKLVVIIVPIITLFLISSYIRLTLSFQNYFLDSNTVLNIKSLEEFLLIQPLLYLIPNFHNLEIILFNLNIDYLYPWVNLKFYNSIFEQPWNMTTFFGDFRKYSFLLNFALLTFFLVIIKTNFTNRNFSEKSLLIISYLLPKLFLLFAGNLFDYMSFYILIIVLLIPTKKYARTCL